MKRISIFCMFALGIALITPPALAQTYEGNPAADRTPAPAQSSEMRGPDAESLQQQEQRATSQGQPSAPQTPASSGELALDPGQSARVSAAIRNQKTRPLTNVNFSVVTGTVVPTTVQLAPLPGAIEEIVPRYRGYGYLVVEQQVVIVEPSSREIVMLMPLAEGSARAQAAPESRGAVAAPSAAAPPKEEAASTRSRSQRAERAAPPPPREAAPPPPREEAASPPPREEAAPPPPREEAAPPPPREKAATALPRSERAVPPRAQKSQRADRITRTRRQQVRERAIEEDRPVASSRQMGQRLRVGDRVGPEVELRPLSDLIFGAQARGRSYRLFTRDRGVVIIAPRERRRVIELFR